MRFRSRSKEEPEINLIPFIDVLLVVLIFLMLTTSFSKFTELKVTLPVADAEQLSSHAKELVVSVTANGRYAVNSVLVNGKSVDAIANALRAAGDGSPDSVVIINADATAPHQLVVTVMEAARRTGLNKLTFASQTTASHGSGAD